MQMEILFLGGNPGAFQTCQAAQPASAISEHDERQQAIAELNKNAPSEAQLALSSSPAVPAVVPANRGPGALQERSRSDDDVEIGAEIEYPPSPDRQPAAHVTDQLLMTPSGTTHSKAELGSRSMLSPYGSHYNMMYTLGSPTCAQQPPRPLAQLPAPPAHPSLPSSVPLPHPASSSQQLVVAPHHPPFPTPQLMPPIQPHTHHTLPQSFVPNPFTSLQPHIAANPQAAAAWAPTGHQDMVMAAYRNMQQHPPVVSDQLVQAVANQIVTTLTEQFQLVRADGAPTRFAGNQTINPPQHQPQLEQSEAAPGPMASNADSQKTKTCINVPTVGSFTSTGVVGIYNWWTGKTINSRINGKSPRELEEDESMESKDRTSWRSAANGKQNFSDLKKCIDAIYKKAVSMGNQRQKPVSEEEAARALDAELAAYRENGHKMSFYDFVKKFGCKLPEH